MEVEKALKQMHPLTAPGLDDMSPFFYHHFLSTIKSIVILTALDFLNHGVSPPKFYDTHIVLIPKIKNPEKVTDYRLISLCNVAYKIASKGGGEQDEIGVAGNHRRESKCFCGGTSHHRKCLGGT